MTTPIDELAGPPAEAFDREYRALMDELAESPLPGARYAWEVVGRRGPKIKLAVLAALSTPVPASNVSEGLREAVERYIVAMTRRASGGTTDAEVQAAYEALYDAAAAPNDAALAHAAPEGLDEPTLTKAIGKVARVVGGELLEGGPRHWIALSSAILEALPQPDATDEAGLSGHLDPFGNPYFAPGDYPDATEEAGR